MATATPKKPKRPCKECGDWGFIPRAENDPGPMKFCPTCVTPFITEKKALPPPEGTRLNTWGMPIAEPAKAAQNVANPKRVPSTKAKASRDAQNRQHYGFEGG